MLMNYLVSQYGQKTLSGQQHNSSENLSFPVEPYLSQSGGLVPAIRGTDFIEYSPSRSHLARTRRTKPSRRSPGPSRPAASSA